MESGIDAIAVAVTPDVREKCEAILPSWQGPARTSQDWLRLQNEKLSNVIASLRFIECAAIDPSSVLNGCRDFIGDDSFALLPADTLYISNTKDRCLQQLLAAASGDVDCVLAVRAITASEAYSATVVRAVNNHPFARILEVVEQPSLERCPHLYTAGFPAGQYLAATGMCLLSPVIATEGLQGRSLFAAIHAACHRDNSFASQLSAACFDLQTPFGFLEAQLGLGLSGIHRVEICELIARTLSTQIKN